MIKFWINSDKRVGGSKVNLLSPAIAIWFDCGLLAVLCCHLATENVMKLLFLAFRYVAAGGGVCCAAHHSLFVLMLIISVWVVVITVLNHRPLVIIVVIFLMRPILM